MALRSKNLNIPWAFMGRADISDRETLVALRKSGLYSVKFAWNPEFRIR